MENDKSNVNDLTRHSPSQKKADEHNTSDRNSRQEQQANISRTNKSSQENSGDKYLSNGYLDDKERYDDSEL